MAQHDYTIANQGFPAFRSDLNDALAAIVSNNSGATEPTTMFAHQMWVDTAANPSILKIRNADNDAWITIGTINQTGDTFTLTSAVSATTLNTSGAVVFNDAGADVDFRVEGDTDANLLFVDASADKVGIGTTSLTYKLEANGAIRGKQNIHVGRASDNAVIGSISEGTSSGFLIEAQAGGSDSTIQFKTSATERARIDSSGNLLVGTTSGYGSGKIQYEGTNSDGVSGKLLGSTGACFVANVNNTAQQLAYFIYQDSTEVGKITTNGTSTTYATSSDYRLKENVAPMTGALAKVLELNPVTYTWKANGSAGEGFIAHELQAVCPQAVTGEKDETEIQQVEVSPAVPATYDDEGNELTPAVEAVYEEREVPVYQGVDTSFLVATLTAAIQELSAKNDALEARIAALENA